MAATLGRARYFVALLTALLIFQAGAIAPAFVVAEEQVSSPPSTQPAPSTEPSPSTDPRPSTDPVASPSPSAGSDVGPVSRPLGPEDPGVERVEMRTRYSKTFERSDGKFVSRFYSDAVHQQSDTGGPWRPIDLSLRTSTSDATAIETTDAPIQLILHPADKSPWFLTLAGGGHVIRFGLPPGTAPGVRGTPAQIKENGLFADYADFLPGGIDLRVFPESEGFKSFLVLPSPPATNSFSFAIQAPNLSLVSDGNGGFEFRDPANAVVGRIPRPFMEDSSVVEGRGGGLYSEAVTQAISETPGGWLLTLTIDEAFLDSAVYPVYVDPTTTTFPTGTTTAGDSFVNSETPNTNYNKYRRSSSPYYYEMWHGRTPDLPYYNEIFIRFNDLAETLGAVTIDSATLDVYPYHQYYDSTAKGTWIERVAEDWTAGGVTWNNKPMVDPTRLYGKQNTSEDVWSNFDVRAFVQDVANGTIQNYGLKLHANSLQNGGWKRIVSRNESSATNLRPYLEVKWHRPAATPAAPINDAPGGRGLIWAYDPGDVDFGTPQSHYWVQVATSNAFDTIVAETEASAGVPGFVAGTTPDWAIPETVVLTEGATYWWRVKVMDGYGESTWSAGASFNFADGQGRGEEAYYTRVPFDLGGGWRMGVGVHNGELTLDRHLFEIPSYGPAQSLNLRYSSANPTVGYFGKGWSSNLTQHLTFDVDTIYWHRADGAVVPFTLGGSDWTWKPPAGHHETLVEEGGNMPVVITLKDQTRLIFEPEAPGRLYAVENRFGQALTLTWGTTSASATDESGRTTGIAVSSGRITSVSDSAGRAWSFAYSGNDLTEITDPAGNQTTLEYATGPLSGIVRTRTPYQGLAETITWSVGYSGGRVTSVTDPVNSSVTNTFGYSAGTTTAGLLKQYSPVVRSTWSYTVDAAGRVTSSVDPEGYTTKYTFDANSNLTRLVLPITATSTQTIDYTYDTRGNVETQTTQLTATESVTTLMEYNATNDLLIRSEANNDEDLKLVTKYTYDGVGRLTSVNVNCTTSGTTPPLDASTCTGGGTQDSATNLITSLTYTANHQIETETDPRGMVTKHVYDTYGAGGASYGYEVETIQNYVAGQSASADRNVGMTFAFDQGTTAGKAGLVTSSTDALLNTTTFTYDVFGRQLTEVLPGDASIPALTRTTTYDELGNVLTQNDSWPGASHTTTYGYDRANRLIATTYPGQAASMTAYDAAGNAISSSVGGVSTTQAFDGLGRLTCESTGDGDCSPVSGPPSGAVMTYSYDAQGRQTQTVDAEGVTTYLEFDLGGRLTRQALVVEASLLEELVATYAYDLLGRQIRYTPPAVEATSTAYDRIGRVICERDGIGACPDLGAQFSTYAYDRAGNVTTATDRAGTVTTTQYDALNRVKVVISNDVAGTPTTGEDVTSEVYYDAAGNEVATAGPDGSVTRSLYGARNALTRTISNCTDVGTSVPDEPDSCTGQGTQTGVHNVVTAFAYDGSGRERASMDARGTVARTFYDALGRSTKVIANCTDDDQNPAPPAPTGDWWNCDGSSLNDGTWNVTTLHSYDGTGNLELETAPNGRVTKYVYDTSDQLIERIDNYVSGTPAAGENVSTFFAYDDAGRESAVRVATAGTLFSVTRYLYDDAGRLITEIRNCTDSGVVPPGELDWKTCAGGGTSDASTNLVTHYGYDARGNRAWAQVPDPSVVSSNATATVTTRHIFDSRNRLCRVIENATVDPSTLSDPCTTVITGTATQDVSTRYSYDDLDNLVSMIDARGNETTYAYDEFGRMTAFTDALGATTTWTYNDLGQRTAQSERGNGSQPTLISWTYDDAGRVLTKTADDTITTYGYDVLGNMTSAQTGGGPIVSAVYDRLNRPIGVSVSGDASAATTYSYDFLSPSRTDPSGTYNATLDALGRQASLSDPINGSVDWLYSYRSDGQVDNIEAPNGNKTSFTYDAAGTLTGKSTTSGSTNRVTYTWERNRAGRILEEEYAKAAEPMITVNYAYDALGRLSTFNPGGVTTAYGWQAVPNRDSVQVGSGLAETLDFDAANRINTSGYAHDEDGRMTARPGQVLKWDGLGRLQEVQDASSNVIATYTYDALDRLLIVDRGPTDKLRFRYVGLTTQVAQIVDHDDNDVVIRSFANDFIGTRLLDWTGPGSDQRYYGTNGHHDVSWIADSTGEVTATLRYDPWGELLESTGSSLPDHRFQGSWRDTDTDLHWMVARWYAPDLGRFVSEDVLLGRPEAPVSRHLFAYGVGDPVQHWDPDGRYYVRVRSGQTTLGDVAVAQGMPRKSWKSIWNRNRATMSAQPPFGRSGPAVSAGHCVYILSWQNRPNECWFARITGDVPDAHRESIFRALGTIGYVLGIPEPDWSSVTYDEMTLWTSRFSWWRHKHPRPSTRSEYIENTTWWWKTMVRDHYPSKGGTLVPGARLPSGLRNTRVRVIEGNREYPDRFTGGRAQAITLGRYVFITGATARDYTRGSALDLMAHEYIHVLQYESAQPITEFALTYWLDSHNKRAQENKIEAIAYLWEGFMATYAKWGEPGPWKWFTPLF